MLPPFYESCVLIDVIQRFITGNEIRYECDGDVDGDDCDCDCNMMMMKMMMEMTIVRVVV